MKEIKLLIGGSPCTYWSIAKANRETKCEGMGWELFKNYLIAKDKFKPDYFLYENVKSARQEIKDEIKNQLGGVVTYINSALVSAQNRNRFYVTNFGDIEQPKDRGILLRDILEDKEYISLNGNNNNGAERDAQRLIKKVGILPNSTGEMKDSQANRIYSADAKSVTLNALGGGLGAKTGLYALGIASRTRSDTEGKYKKYEYNGSEKSNSLTTVQTDSMIAIKGKNVVEVRNGLMKIKDREYPIKLEDGLYDIRKLTPIECERLQTMPDNYTSGVSDSQRYKMLGNGWTAEVIIHILNHALKDVDKNTKIKVLSMYDGIGTGRYCLDKMGFKNVEYYAYEIDKYAIQTAKKNYPDIIEMGDAFDIRREDWKLQKDSTE